jgi:DNA excision repair protein ERCC-8
VSRELIASLLHGSVDPNSVVSGGADSSIKLWDLDEHPVGANHTFRPTGLVSR